MADPSKVQARLAEIRERAKRANDLNPGAAVALACFDVPALIDLLTALLAEREASTSHNPTWEHLDIVRAADAALARFAEGV
jgi:hypothetical protein